MKIFKPRLFIILILCLIGSDVLAQTCTTATCTANSCSESDFLAALPSSGNTNSTVTVNIPACSATTWTSQLAYTQPTAVTTLNILGSGTPNSGSGTTGASSSCTATNIVDNYTSARMFDISISYPQVFMIGCMTLDPNTASTALWNPILISGTCTSSGCPSIRIHNFNFGYNTQWSESGNSANAESVILAQDVFGVIDHNTLCTPSNYCPNSSGEELLESENGQYLGVGQYGDNSWAQPDTLGGANNLFVENNTIYNGGYLPLNDSEQSSPFSSRGGSRVVARYNTFHQGLNNHGGFGFFADHGTESGGRARGAREAEVYNNTLYCDGTSQNCSGIDGGLRSGTGLFFNNVMTSSISSIGPFVTVQAYRTAIAETQPFSPQCGGFSPWDVNGSASISASSTVTAEASGTVTDSSQTWAAHQFKPTASGNAYAFIDFTALSNAASIAFITDNTANQLSIGSLAAGSITTGDTYYISGTAALYTGTSTSVSNVDPNSQPANTYYDTMTDSSASFASLLPSGAPYSVCDMNRGWCSEITSFTATSITVEGCIDPPGGCTPYGFANGDQYVVVRSTECLDQSTRGQQTSTILSGDAPTPVAAVTEKLDPVYHWGDSVSGATPSYDVFTGTARLISYRDFYTQATGIQTSSSSPFSCNGSTGGTGWGTLANRPSSCSGSCSTNSPGCGYWATDTSTLYTWQSGAWVSYYQPYTYPHPLDINNMGITPAASIFALNKVNP